MSGPFLAFNDNTASEHALTRGLSSDPGTNAVISHYWGAASHFRSDVWFNRVTSAANVGDAVSREDFQFARESGWRRYTPSWELLWPALTSIATPPFELGPDALRLLLSAAADALGTGDGE